MASIHEVKDENDNVLSYYVSYRFKDRTGKTKQSTKRGFLRKKDAEAFKRDAETAFYNNVVKPTDSITVSELFDEWYKLIDKRLSMDDLAMNTVKGYRVNIKHIKDGLGKIKLADLTTEAIEDFYLAQYESGNYRTGKSLSAASIQFMHTNLKSALDFAVNKHFAKLNPAVGATKVAKQLRKPRICSPEEIERINQYALGTELEMPVYLALSLGLRRGEALGLKWNRIDFENKTISIEEQWALGPNGYDFVGLKSNYSRRTLPIDDNMVRRLLAVKTAQDSLKEKLGIDYAEHGLVCQRNGMPLRPECMTQAFSRLIDKLGIPLLRFHDLRHTFASRALSKGVPLLIVSRMLGHANISITADIYGHPTDEAFRSGASIAYDAIWYKK